MNRDKPPTGDGPYDLVDGSPFDQASTYSPMIEGLRTLVESAPSTWDWVSVYAMQDDTFSVKPFQGESGNSADGAQNPYDMITSGILVMAINREAPFAEQLCKSGINFNRITDFPALRDYLTSQNKLWREAHTIERDRSAPSNLPVVINSADGHIPHLAFTRNSKKINEFQNRCDTANISLIFNGGITTPFSMRTINNLRLKVAAEWGVLSEDYENHSAVPKNLKMEEEMFEYFLKTKDEIFVCYRNRWSNTVTSDQFNTASEAVVGIDQRIKTKDFYLTMVLDGTHSFADHIKGKYISINHLEKHPIIAPNALADRPLRQNAVERPEPFEWR